MEQVVVPGRLGMVQRQAPRLLPNAHRSMRLLRGGSRRLANFRVAVPIPVTQTCVLARKPDSAPRPIPGRPGSWSPFLSDVRTIPMYHIGKLGLVAALLLVSTTQATSALAQTQSTLPERRPSRG